MFEDLIPAEQKIKALLESKTIHGLIFLGKRFISIKPLFNNEVLLCGIKL